VFDQLEAFRHRCGHLALHRFDRRGIELVMGGALCTGSAGRFLPAPEADATDATKTVRL
jgi:hypothetical protein